MAIRLNRKVSFSGVALPLALSFSLLFLLISMALLESYGILSKEIRQIQNKEKILRQIDQMEDSLIDSSWSDEQLNRSETLTLQGVNVSWQTNLWGGFTLYTIRAEHNGSVIRKALFKCRKLKKGSTAFFMKEDLLLSGNTLLKGPVFGRKKIRRARLNGNGFTGDISGARIFENYKDLPQEVSVPINIPVTIHAPGNVPSKLTNSFPTETIVYRSKDDISLDNCSLYGNLIIESDQKVIAGSSSDLRDLIIKAEEIIISDNFKGNIQCIASKKIVVGMNAELLFPSGLYVIGPGNKEIVCKTGSQVHGIVYIKNTDLTDNLFSPKDQPIERMNKGGKTPKPDEQDQAYINRDKEASESTVQYSFKDQQKLQEEDDERSIVRSLVGDSWSTLRLEKNSTITGEVYCNGVLINEGTIKGILAAKTSAVVIGSETNSGYLGTGNIDGSESCMVLCAQSRQLEKTINYGDGLNLVAKRVSVKEKHKF